jgi:5,5'-dehydrodivanillate O-demethylase
MGPPPAPELLRLDGLERGVKHVGESWFDCNWLQGMENHMDQAHVFILHQNTAQRGVDGMNTVRGRIDALEGLDYREVPFGIRRRQEHTSGYIDIDLMIFPNIQRTYDHFGFRVPIDDTHQKRYSVFADLGPDGPSTLHSETHVRGTIEYDRRAPQKTPVDAIHPNTRYHMNGVVPQDQMALETQGPIADRTVERLATSDRGIVLYRNVLKREIEKVQQGLDPIGVVRDPDQEPLDTAIDNWIDMIQRFPPANPRRR